MKLFITNLKIVLTLILKSLTSNHKFKGVSVVLGNKLMEESGLIFALAFKLSFLKIIIVDDNFYEFSKTTQEFILAHEYGHIIDEEISNKPIWIKNQERLEAMEKGLVYTEEAFADDFGVSVVGLDKSITALEDIREAMSIFFNKDEIDLRIKRLSNN